MEKPKYSLDTLIEEEKFSLHDVEALRLILSGGSIINWRRLNFRSDDEIRSFLLTNCFNPSDHFDRARLFNLYRRACDYLEDYLHIEIPVELREPKDVFVPFRFASRWHERSKNQACACMLLKIVHVLNYIDGKELTHQLPLSNNQLSNAVSRKIIAELTQMSQYGLTLANFSGGFKSRSSVVAKLLLRTENLAMPIFDRIRFRMVTKDLDDIVPVLHYFMKFFLPFNYIVPGESSNKLLSLTEVLENEPRLSLYIPVLQRGKQIEKVKVRENEFSGRDYKAINFICDIPLRIDKSFADQSINFEPQLGRLIFVLVEFQILDDLSNMKNEQGESSHASYKIRQKQGVIERLTGDKAGEL